MTSAPEDSQHFRIKAVCLDVDDTLLDAESASRQGLRELVGNDRAWPVWRRTTDRYYARFVAGELDFDAMCVERTRAFFAAFGEHLDDAEAARREDRRMRAMRRAWRLFDDVLPCLDWLRAAGLRLAVVTNAAGPYQREKIAALGLADAFDAVVISEEVGVAKPHPRIFATAATALGVEPAEVVHVGDRLDTDARGAARAGMHGVWLDRRGTGRAPDGATAVIGDLHGLTELIACDLPVGVPAAVH